MDWYLFDMLQQNMNNLYLANIAHLCLIIIQQNLPQIKLNLYHISLYNTAQCVFKQVVIFMHKNDLISKNHFFETSASKKEYQVEDDKVVGGEKRFVYTFFFGT